MGSYSGSRGDGSNLTSMARSMAPSLFSTNWSNAFFGPRGDKWYQGSLATTVLNTLVTAIGGAGAYIVYQKIVNKDPRSVSELLVDLRSLGNGSKKSTITLPPATRAALETLKASTPSLLSRLNPLNWKIFNKTQIARQRDDEMYQAGEPYGDPDVLSTGLADDLKAIGTSANPKQLSVLIDLFKSKGKPINDREMTMEKMIALTATLPTHSLTRKKLTGVVIDTLWTSLQHPPLSYLGDKYQYRTPDGSYNNPLQPDLGKAGSPYAKTVKKLKALHGTPPDPGLLFDLLMARTNESFKENPAGVSSVLFYNATIIIHDVFRSNRFDNRISDTSSYLDLAPLYGSSLDDQLAIRTMKNGMLKPDTFSEKRLLGQPPGVNAILVMYSRFHNYVADTLLKINEYGRFTLPPTKTDEEKEKALAKQDNDLFQTARLIVGGLYVNICLNDYLRGLTNTHHSKSDWQFDPRVDVDRTFDKDGVPKGMGNQVSAEFNLLYRFHATISLRDEKWTNDFMKGLFPDINKPLDQLTPQEFVMGLFRFEQSIPVDPSKREFGGLKRGADGKFNDADLVKVLQESMEDPAGLFGARMVPKALKMIEVAGILSSRKWQLASLNEMRSFFGLATHETFEDINPNPEIADLMRKLYQDPDMVEMYPGLFLEDAKPRMDPGCGGCPPYTVGRAVFSDAVTLVRSDRFLTIDYTTSTLTNWGMREVQPDQRVLGGSMFYKLFQRALPGWFPYNSLHVMQPMFTRKMNEQIAREIGTIDHYTLNGPAPPPTPVIVADKSVITAVLKDQNNFRVPWGKPFSEMFGGKNNYGTYMLSGDTAAHTAQRNLVGDTIYAAQDFSKLLLNSTIAVATEYLKSNTMTLSRDLKQIDIIRDVGIPVNTRILSDLFNLDLRSSENPKGSLNIAEMYKHLINVRIWGFNNSDVALAWKRRMWAEDGATILTESTKKSVSATLSGMNVTPMHALVDKYRSSDNAADQKATVRWFGQAFVKELAASGKKTSEIVDICWLTALAGVGVVQSLLAECLTFFLKPENKEHWAALQTLAASSNADSANATIRKYVLEAQRMMSSQRNLRICANDTEVQGQKFKRGDAVVCLLGIAGRNPKSIPEPDVFKIGRPADSYLHFGAGPHTCLGREIALTMVTAIIKVCAGMKNLRPAPGEMGSLKTVTMGTEKFYLNSSWSYLTTDPTTWTLHFEGTGTGVYTPPAVSATAGRNLDAIFNALKKKDAEDSKEDIPSEVVNANKFPPPPISKNDPQAATIISGPDGDKSKVVNGNSSSSSSSSKTKTTTKTTTTTTDEEGDGFEV